MSSATSPGGSSAVNPAAPRGTHHQRLARLGAQERQRRQTIIAVSTLGVFMLLAGALAALDYAFELSAITRLFLWGTSAAAVVVFIVSSKRWREFESRDAACQAERVWPEIGQRLRTSHDYQMKAESVSPADPDLLRALETETQDWVNRQPPTPLGSSSPIAALLGLCAAGAVAWLIAMAVSADWRTATARLGFLPLHYSRIILDPLPESLHQGDDLVVRLDVQGRPLQSARLLYRNSDQDDWSEVEFRPSVASALVDKLSAVVPDCQSDMEVLVEAGHLHTDTQLVAVHIPLVLEQWKALVTPPGYTQLGTQEGTPQEVRIPAGSAVQLEANYNRPPGEVTAALTPEAPTPAATRLVDAAAHVSVEVLREPTDLLMRATAEAGVVDESDLYLDVIPDRQPRLRFLAPDEDAEAIATAELRFSLEAFDDYGLREVGIRYRIDDGPEQTLWEGNASQLSNAMANTVRLPLEDLNVSYPQAITYYAYAVDNREPESQRATSELRFIDIRPFSREYEFKEGSCQGECLSLEKLIHEQRGILGRTFAASLREEAGRQLGSGLAADERELRAKTETLTAALEEKVGDFPSLGKAIEAMSDAEQDLTNQDIAQGQVDLEHALAHLIAARSNLRKIMRSGDSQGQMARNIDQQQLDKLRPPERDLNQDSSHREQQELSQLRKQLDELASQQQRFSGAGQSTGELAAQQQKSADQTRNIQKALDEGDFGELAPQRAAKAAESIEQSGQALASEQDALRARALAGEAADQLKRLSEHLGQRQNPDFADKLATAEREARRLSEKQSQLAASLNSESDLPSGQPSAGERETLAAEEQGQLADEADELTDLIDQLLADSSNQDWEVQRDLAEQVRSNSPAGAAAGMRRTLNLLEQGQTGEATQHGSRDAAILARLAAGLQEIGAAVGSNQLAELIAAERQAAALLRELQRAERGGLQAMARAEARQFAEELQSLARNDLELRRAAQFLTTGNPGPLSNDVPASDKGDFSQGRSGFATPPTTDVDAVRQIDLVLQRRIQEAMLKGAMQQAVGAVPPQYSDMVDDYYRALSEDIE